MTDSEAIKQRQRRIWGLGDYSVLSRQLAPAAVELSDACAVSAGQEVLDVAAGDGNFALACAREGASVVASDLSPRMVELGPRPHARPRATTWSGSRPTPRRCPSRTPASTAPAPCSARSSRPRPEVMASELFRVVRPGNTVGLTAWVPDSVMPELFDVGRRFARRRPTAAAAGGVGRRGHRRASALDGLAGHVECETRTLVWTGASPEEFEAELSGSAPAYAAAQRGALRGGLRRAARRLAGAAARRNTADDGTLRIEADYLVVVARKRG